MASHPVQLLPRHCGEVRRVRQHKDEPHYAARFRRITRYNPQSGRFYGRAPKLGALIRDLAKHREDDYGPERPLPRGAMLWSKIVGYGGKRKA